MQLYYDDNDNDLLVVQADGELNAKTAEAFVERIEKLVDGGLKKVIVDCSGMEYISSYGLGVLVRLHKRMKLHDGDVKICSLKGLLADVLKVSRLNQYFDVYQDLPAARMAFGPKLP